MQLFERVEDACRFRVGCGFDNAAALDPAELNTSAFQPPMEHCTFRIVEAVVAAEP